MAEGYTKIKNKLFEDLARLKASSNAYMVLNAIIRNTICFHQNQRELANTFLQDATGLGERSVRRAIRELEDLGIIKIVSPNCGSHPRTIRIYPDKIDRDKGDKSGRVQNAPGEGDKSDRDKGDKSGRYKGDKSDPQEIKETKYKKEIEKKASPSLSTIEEMNEYYEAHPELWEDEI